MVLKMLMLIVLSKATNNFKSIITFQLLCNEKFKEKKKSLTDFIILFSSHCIVISSLPWMLTQGLSVNPGIKCYLESHLHILSNKKPQSRFQALN